jgi:hypothetical protein
MHEGRVTSFFFITKLARKEMDEGRAARLLALSHSCFSARKFDLFYFFYFVIRATMLLALSHSCFSARKFDLFYFFYFVIRATMLLALSHSCFSARKFDLFYFFILLLEQQCYWRWATARKFDLFYFFYLYVFLEYDGVYILVYHVVKNNEQQDSDKTSALKSKRDLRKR